MSKRFSEEFTAWVGAMPLTTRVMLENASTGAEYFATLQQLFAAIQVAQSPELLALDEKIETYDRTLTVASLKGWVISESYEISDIILDGDGNIISAVIKWPDDDIGSISNVVVGVHGITSVRYNRSQDGVYATTNISYSNSGEVTAQEIVLKGI